MDTQEKTLGLYIHIPFCRSKCLYCDFYSLPGSRSRDLMREYRRALIENIREGAKRAPSHTVDTIYFGGGTPSYFGAENLKPILAEAARRFNVAKDAEISLEANPDSVDYQSLRALRRAGFNRISIGVQSDSDEMLKALGRPHSWEQSRKAVAAARDAGFEEISTDLMFGLPNQTRDGWAQTLNSIVNLKPTHVSCYALQLEEGTPFYSYRDYANLPDEDTQADMYLYAAEALESYGYPQYEISNFAREGSRCRHNLKYWTGGEYMGFGASAASDFSWQRYTYAADVNEYIKGINEGGNIISEYEELPLKYRAGEYIMLRMRCTDGIEENEYRSSFLSSFEPLEKLLTRYKSAGLAVRNGERWRFTPKGFLISNQLIGDLIDAQVEAQPLAKRNS